MPAGLTFRDWLRGTDQPRPPGIPGPAGPTADDLIYHLSTLFPPVRPRGHLELRMIDAQPGDGWIVPVAVVAALTDDPVAADAAMAAVEPVWHQLDPADSQVPAARAGPGRQATASPWLRAARLGLADPVLAKAAQQCFEAADSALGPAGRARRECGHAVADFAERYVRRGRCPADDILDSIAHLEGQS